MARIKLQLNSDPTIAQSELTQALPTDSELKAEQVRTNIVKLITENELPEIIAQNLHSSTFRGDSDDEQLFKLEYALQLRKTIPPYGRSIYFASGVDVEFPLLLGKKEFLMIDPIFTNPDAVNHVQRALHKYSSNITEEDVIFSDINVPLVAAFSCTIRGELVRIGLISLLAEEAIGKTGKATHIFSYLRDPHSPPPWATQSQLNAFSVGTYYTDDRSRSMGALVFPSARLFTEPDMDPVEKQRLEREDELKSVAAKARDEASGNRFGSLDDCSDFRRCVGIPNTWQYIGKGADTGI